MTMSEVPVPIHALHEELAERLAETQKVLSFARLLPAQRDAERTVIPFPVGRA